MRAHRAANMICLPTNPKEQRQLSFPQFWAPSYIKRNQQMQNSQLIYWHL